MELDKKTVAGAVAAVAVGAIGAAVAYTALSGEGADSDQKPPKPSDEEAKPTAHAAPTGAISINKASRDELMSLKHIGKARAKRILMSRPFKSVDDLLSRGLLPEDVLTRHRDRLTV
jgi:DNA uptake protein ComE-like DNA-binding protein